MKKKKMIFNSIFFIALIILTYVIIFKNEDMSSIISNLNNLNKKYVLAAIIVMTMGYVFEAINIKRLLASLKTKISLMKSLKFTMIGVFFSAITPAASGGQPLEIYYMSKENIKVSHSTIALIMHLYGFQTSVILFAILACIYNTNPFDTSVLIFLIIGILFNAISLSFTLIALFSEKLSRALINVLIKILKFFKVRNIENKIQKINDELKIYNESAKFIKKEKGVLITSIIYAMLQLICTLSVTYLVYKAFNLNEYSYIEILSLQAILRCAIASIPLPGAVGISESLFLRLFTPVFGTLLADSLLITRGVSFYLFVIVSLVIVFANKFYLYRREKNTQN